MEIQLLLPGENFVLGETGAIALGRLGFERHTAHRRFCHEHTMRTVASLPSLAGCEAKLRLGSAATGSKVDGDQPAVPDNGNYIVDLVRCLRPPPAGCPA